MLLQLQVRSVSFAENGSHFVTVGNRHVKFWYFDTEVEPKVLLFLCKIIKFHCSLPLFVLIATLDTGKAQIDNLY